MPVEYCIYQTTPKSEYLEHYKISVHEAYLGYEDKKNSLSGMDMWTQKAILKTFIKNIKHSYYK